MGLELPLVSAIMARLAEPKISLAAYGGVVFPMALIIEAPVIMLLAASTALAKDKQAYHLLSRFMVWTGAGLTALHILIVSTPLYYFVVGKLIDAPPEIWEPARLGLIIMIPWTWAIAYRRLQQGVLIRFGRSHRVGIGTVVRLSSNISILAIGFAIGTLPGIAVGTAGIAVGVCAEALYAWFAVREIVKNEIPDAPPETTSLTQRGFFGFYIPLALTSLLALLSLPIGSAAISRMPRALDSLAVWPVLTGLTFTMRSLTLAFNEAVVALLDAPRAVAALRRFTLFLAAGTSTVLLILAATPLAATYFGGVSGLSPTLRNLAGQGIWLAIILPGFGAFQNFFQGALVHTGRTRAITEAVTIYIGVSATVLILGIWQQSFVGLFVALVAAVCGYAAQLLWLWHRSRPALHPHGHEEPIPIPSEPSPI